jgi:hypothetical protein
MFSRTGRIDKRDLSMAFGSASQVLWQPDGNRQNKSGSWIVPRKRHMHKAVGFPPGA